MKNKVGRAKRNSQKNTNKNRINKISRRFITTISLLVIFLSLLNNIATINIR